MGLFDNKCPSCGGTLHDDVNVCWECGEILDKNIKSHDLKLKYVVYTKYFYYNYNIVLKEVIKNTKGFSMYNDLEEDPTIVFGTELNYAQARVIIDMMNKAKLRPHILVDST